MGVEVTALDSSLETSLRGSMVGKKKREGVYPLERREFVNFWMFS
jgi:hypothetical protein